MIRAEDDPNNKQRAGRQRGRALMDAAHAVLEARREWFLIQARRELLAVLLERGTASADDVRERLKLPANIGPVCLGAVPKPLALAGIIRRISFVASARPEAHARPVSLWELVDAHAARQWLADHPAPLPLTSPVDAVETCEAAPVVDAAESAANHQRCLFDGEG